MLEIDEKSAEGIAEIILETYLDRPLRENILKSAKDREANANKGGNVELTAGEWRGKLNITDCYI